MLSTDKTSWKKQNCKFTEITVSGLRHKYFLEDAFSTYLEHACVRRSAIRTAQQMHFWLLLFQVLLLFVALGLFLLKFVENPLVFPQIKLPVKREIFMIMAGMCNPVAMSLRGHYSDHCRKITLKNNSCNDCIVQAEWSSPKIGEQPFTDWICESENSLAKLTILATFLTYLILADLISVVVVVFFFASQSLENTSSRTVLTCWRNCLNFVSVCFPRYKWMNVARALCERESSIYFPRCERLLPE